MSESEPPPPPAPPPPYAIFSSLPSLLADIEDGDEDGDGEPVRRIGSLMWQAGVDVDWQERCFQLELSLHRFRRQAAKIRELLREKLTELERRVAEAERRAEDAEERALLMEQKLPQPAWKSEQQSESGIPSNQDINKLEKTCREKDKIISSLEQQVAEQKKLRMQEAKQVEAKAAKIKEWVTHKLKELEEQNQHLREQNQKCNKQLELLKNRLTQLSQLSPKSHQTHRDHSTETTTEQERTTSDITDQSSTINESGKEQSFKTEEERKESVRVAHTYPRGTDVSRLKGQICSCSAKPKSKPQPQLDHEGNIIFISEEMNKLEEDLGSYRESLVDTILSIEDAVSRSPSQTSTKESENTEILSIDSNTSQSKDDYLSDEGCHHHHHHHHHQKVSTRTESKLESLARIGGSLDRKLTGQRKMNLDDLRAGFERRWTVKADNEIHDYAEIYTPSNELPIILGLDGKRNKDQDAKPPTPPLHRFPSWESRIYDIAVSGISLSCDSLQATTTGSPKNTGKPSESNINGAFTDLNIPVYATVKGRASQIRCVPFTGESTDSSDNEDTRITIATTSSHTTSGETESSASTGSPSRGGKTGDSLSDSPAKKSCPSPTKSVKRDTSTESVLSDDYAIPPDALSADTLSVDSIEHPSLRIPPTRISSKRESLEKSGYLTKLGGKLKTWRRRWFVLKNGVLSYYKTQNDVNRKPQGQIVLDEVCRVNRAEGAATFEVSTSKRNYYLTADSISTMEEWIRVLQNVLRRKATRLLLSRAENKPTTEGWLTKVKHGHSRRCWCVLIGRMFLYFKTPSDTTPLGQINMRDAQVEEVVHISDSDEEDQDENVSRSEYTVAIYPNHQGPTYLLLSNKQEMDAWLYNLTVVSSGDNLVGTQYEQLIARLMEVDGDETSVIWRHPLLLYSKENITQALTTLPSEQLQAEAVKLFKSIQLFISVPLDTSGIDYHVALAQNALQQCLTLPELQNEFYCQLVKQTARHSQQRVGVQQLLLCATQSLFLCDASTGEKTSPTSITPTERPPPSDSKLNPLPFVFVQGWQLLALAISLFLPKNRTLWYLRAHLQRNMDAKTESGKYAIFCQRALERALINGGRECKPSRTEVLSILLKNPFHHSMPHSIPVHFQNNSYQVVGFDGSTTVEEFIHTLNAEAGIRDMSQSGFALYSDDPIEKNLEHCLNNCAKLCDVISKWEQALREKHLGKFESTRVIKLMYKNRLCFRQLLKAETDKERLLTVYTLNDEIIQGRFPLSRELSLELAALMAQIEFGDYCGEKVRGSGLQPTNPEQLLQQVIDRFYPHRYKDGIDEKQLAEIIKEKWLLLKGRSVLDCVRIYLNCARKWSFCGAKLFSAKMKSGDQISVWLAVTEDSIALLDYVTMQVIARYPYSGVITFGGCRDDFMLVVCPPEMDCGTRESHVTQRLLFAMSKPKILEITLLVADYMNAMGRTPVVPPSPQASTLTRLEKIKSKIRATTGTTSSVTGSIMASCITGIEIDGKIVTDKKKCGGGSEST